MSNARPLARLVAESLQSLPWTRSSISLGRPYNPRYRFRKLHTRPRRARGFSLADHPEYGLLEQQRAARLTSTFDPWDQAVQEKETVEKTEEVAAEEAVVEEEEGGDAVSFMPLNTRKNTLVSRYDSALKFDYDLRVGTEEEAIQGRSANELYSILRVAASEGKVESIFKIQACVNQLVKVHDEQPNLRLYSALILMQCRTDGSVAETQRLLLEMAEAGFEPDIGTCHDVLKVLSVHPDYLLLTDVLQYMRSKWFELSDGGWHDVTAGLIRLGNLEMAWDRLESMRAQGIRILGWLYDLMIYALSMREELDDAFTLLKQRVEGGDLNTSRTLWYHLLDESTRLLHYGLASYIWKSQVQTRYINPSLGMCTNMLTLAARNKDVELVQDVFEFLGKRDTVFELGHYETVMDAYINIGMPEHGFYILSAMQEGKIVPNEGTTRRLYQYLQRDVRRVQAMFEVVKKLKEDGRPIPIAAMNVLIESATYRRDLDLALELYKAIPDICVGSADLTTFNTLFRLCRLMSRKDLAFQLVGEMVALRVSPDALTYDRMILVCLQEEDYEDGISYYKEMRAKNIEPRFGTGLLLVKTLTKHEDPRINDVLEDIEGMDLPFRMPELRRWVSQNLGKREGIGKLQF